jgi:DICT domain-containing protein
MEPSSGATLTIGDLAARTGVPVATIRSWESRYGFPRPTRQAGRHRRYAEGDVAAVLEVVRHRSGGLGLGAAVRRVTAGSVRARSVFAEVRRQHPELGLQVLTKRTLKALSRAIEDECCARAADPLLFGGFQREEFLRGSQARWVDLARTARVAVAFAHLTEPASTSPGGPVEVALPDDAPLGREWFVICDAPDLPACLVAVELPSTRQHTEAQRPFEVLWSVDPAVVRHASRVAATLAEEYRPGWSTRAFAALAEDAPPASDDLRRAAELFDRMLGYLEPRR